MNANKLAQTYLGAQRTESGEYLPLGETRSDDEPISVPNAYNLAAPPGSGTFTFDALKRHPTFDPFNDDADVLALTGSGLLQYSSSDDVSEGAQRALMVRLPSDRDDDDDDFDRRF